MTNQRPINVGDVYGTLCVVTPPYSRNGRPWCWVSCGCGSQFEVRTDALRRQRMCSAACRNKATGDRMRTHGENMSVPEYRAYHGARGRCLDPKDPSFQDYGERGIEFRFKSYEHFLRVLGRKPSLDHSIDRIDVNGHYEPGNVRWATPWEQQRNRRDNVHLTLNGRTQIISDWSAEMGLGHYTITSRLKRGWPVERAILTPGVKPRGR